jgi:hypothetical protein
MRPTSARRTFIWLAALLLPLAGHATCYTVYDRDGRIAVRSIRPPVDLSKTLSETVPRLVAYGHMVMVPDETGCSEVEYRATVAPSSMRIEQRGGSQALSSNLTGAGEVKVGDYYRDDGTRVQTYTRPAPSVP